MKGQCAKPYTGQAALPALQMLPSAHVKCYHKPYVSAARTAKQTDRHNRSLLLTGLRRARTEWRGHERILAGRLSSTGRAGVPGTDCTWSQRCRTTGVLCEALGCSRHSHTHGLAAKQQRQAYHGAPSDQHADQQCNDSSNNSSVACCCLSCCHHRCCPGKQLQQSSVRAASNL